MCGRFTLRTSMHDWSQLFFSDMQPATDALQDDPPRYNIAPTQAIAAVLREATGEAGRVRHLRWGLVPSWAKDLSIGNRMINARGETVDSKPSFRSAFKSRRCLIPADGYYEWKKTSEGKQPYLIEPSGGGIMAMAGLWEENSRVTEDGTPIRTCTIITTRSSDAMAGLHDRMPVLIDEADFGRWLDPGFRDVDDLKALLEPAADDALTMHAVSKRVNSPKHDDVECVEPIETV